MAKVLGTFGKAVKNNRHLSFGISGGKHCEISCIHLKKDCYAKKVENYRKNSVGAKQARHENIHPTNLCHLATYEVSTIDDGNLDWFRFSTFGSVPKKQINKGKGFQNAIRGLVKAVKAKLSNPKNIHFPVESFNKARDYRNILKGLGVVVRQSLQSRKELKDYKGQASIVIGDWSQTPKQRAAEARQVASEQRDKGKTAVVCPAVVSTSKCGQCTACSSKSVDIVLYPLHR
jgi:hypothetical protein